MSEAAGSPPPSSSGPSKAGGSPKAGGQAGAGGPATSGADPGPAGPGGAPGSGSASAKGLGAGTASPGRVSATNSLLRSARASISGQTVTGGVAGRDIAGRDIIVHNYVDPQRAELGASAIEPDHLDAVHHAFVPPADFADLASTVTGQHVIVLRASPGHGAPTAGLKLLVGSGVTQLYRLDPRRPLSELPREQLAESAGYLLSGLSDPQLKALRGHDLSALDAALKPLGGRLVIVIPTGLSAPDQIVASYTVRLGAAPTTAEIVDSHLRWRVGSPGATKLQSLPEVAAAIDDLAGADARCGDAADFARLLAEAYRAAGTVDVEWVRTRMRERAAEDFDTWFDQLGDVTLRSLAVSLALLNGLPFEVVTSAAARLRRRLEAPLLGQTTDPDIRVVTPLPERPDLFRDTRAARLRRLRAQITPTTLPAWFGDTPAQVMSFTDPSYAPAVINRVWDEYDDVRPILMDWLYDLGGHPAEEVRVWVATAVGMLANRAFGHVLTEIIDKWAASPTSKQSEKAWRHREAAAMALNIPATSGGLYAQVQRVVREWSDADGDDPYQTEETARGYRATAARAYGASLGHTAPDQAIAALSYLADCEDFATANAIGRSLAELMDWDPVLTVPVLTAIVQWLDSRTPERVSTGHVAFLRVAIDLTQPVERVGGDDDTISWPTLLRLADTDPTLLPTIAGLWQAALNGPLWSDARVVFGAWAIAVEPDRRPCAALGRLASAAARADRTDRTNKILLRLAADWTTDKNSEPTPRAAAAVITALSDGSHHS